MATDGQGGFGGGPFGDEGGGLLDDLRAGGEEAVNQELAGLQAAMSRVESFGATVASVADADIEALRAEWQTIESELKRALQSGLTAVEERTGAKTQASLDDELTALGTEVARKNDLIAQLSDSVKKLNVELDEKERRLREDARVLRERVTTQEEELVTLRARSSELAQSAQRQAAELEAVNGERDALRLGLSQASEAIEVERAHQEEGRIELEKELNEARLANARLENEKRDAERRGTDLEKRLQAAERARDKAEQERGERTQEVARLSKEAKTATDRATALDADLARQRERIDQDVRRLQRQANRVRADSEALRSRIADALAGLRNSVSMLESLPKEGPAEDEPAET